MNLLKALGIHVLDAVSTVVGVVTKFSCFRQLTFGVQFAAHNVMLPAVAPVRSCFERQVTG